MYSELELARQAKIEADRQQNLINRLPELERKQKEAERARQHEKGKERALREFKTAIEAHKRRDEAFDANYQELRSAFRSFVAMLKADNRSYQNVWTAALQLGYFLAAEDTIFGLTAESQRSWAEQLMKDNDIKNVTLPGPGDFVDHLFNVCLEEALRAA